MIFDAVAVAAYYTFLGDQQYNSRYPSLSIGNDVNINWCARGISNMPELRLSRARKIAAEVRAKHPEMQVRRIQK